MSLHFPQCPMELWLEKWQDVTSSNTFKFLNRTNRVEKEGLPIILKADLMMTRFFFIKDVEQTSHSVN